MPAALPGAGTGLIGQYFADPNLTRLADTRVDPVVDFSWPGSPADGVPLNGFSVRWTGRIQAQTSEPYSLTVTTDEGVRLWVGGEQVIDAWAAQRSESRTVTVAFEAGETYDVRLETRDTTGAARVRLAWSGRTTPAAVVPAAQLYPTGGWLDADLGQPRFEGSFRSDGTAYWVSGSGAASPTRDDGHFAYQSLAGDGEVIAQVTAPAGRGAARGGLMIRGDLSAGAPVAAVTIGADGAQFRWRGASGAAAVTSAAVPVPTGAAWLRLHRDGDVLSGHVAASPTGPWRLVGTAVVPLGRTVPAGLFATSGSALLPAEAGFRDVSVATTTPLGGNLSAVTDWDLSQVFVDAFKQSRAPESLAPGREGQPAAVDANRWATEDARYIVQSGALGVAAGFNGTYKLSFTGRADVGLWVTAGTLSNVVYNPRTNRTTADVTLNAPNDDRWFLALEFRHTAGGVKDVRLIRPGYDPNTTRVFTDAFLAAVSPFHTLRFMDWLQTNGSPNADWAARAKPTDATQATARGVAWEYVVALANEAGKDVWVNVPLHATDDYVRQLATFLRDRLAPDRVVYLEYSNELWNTQFPQTLDNLRLAVAEVEAGMASGRPSPLFSAGETDRRADGSWASDYTWAVRRAARELKDAADTFASVWGAAAINTRVRPVLANQLVNPWVAATQLDFLRRTYGDPRAYLSAIAGGVYADTRSVEGVPGTTADGILAALAESAAWQRQFLPEYTVTALTSGLDHFAYEAGLDTFGWQHIPAKKAASLDPRAGNLVRTMLSDWFDAGGGQVNWFTVGATDYDTPHGTWGLTNDVTNLAAPKYVAAAGVASAARPRPTLGTAIPNAVPATEHFGTWSAGQPYLRWVNPGRDLDYPVRAPTAGAYRLSLEYASANGGRAEVWVNGVRVGELNLPATGPGYDEAGSPNTFATSARLTLLLEEGLGVVRIRIVSGNFSVRTVTFEAPAAAPARPGSGRELVDALRGLVGRLFPAGLPEFVSPVVSGAGSGGRVQSVTLTDTLWGWGIADDAPPGRTGGEERPVPRAVPATVASPTDDSRRATGARPAAPPPANAATRFVNITEADERLAALFQRGDL